MRRAVVIVGVVALVVAALEWPGTSLLPREGLVRTTLLLLVVAAALALARPRVPRLLALPVVAAGLVLVVVTVRAAVATGLPTPPVWLLAPGAVAVGAGVALRALRDRPGGPTTASRRIAFLRAGGVAVVTAAAVVGASAASAAWGDRLPVVSTTAPPGPAAPLVPAPGPVRWTYEDTVPSDAVLPAGRGVVVARTDGIVVGLDGTTGRPRWSSGRTGTSTAVSVTPDRRTVLVEQSAGAGTGASPGRRLLVLDADTGTTRADGPPPAVVAVDDAVLGVSVTGGVEARSLLDGSRRWTAPPPAPGCRTAPGQGRGVGTTTLVLAWTCPGDDLTVQGLDDATGTPRWTVHDQDVVRDAGADPAVVRTDLASVRSAPDGDLVVREGVLLDRATDREIAATTTTIDPATGARRTVLDDRTRLRLTPGSLPVVLATGTTLSGMDDTTVLGALSPAGPVAVPASRCADGYREIALARTPVATVRVCPGAIRRGGGDGPPSVQVDDADPVRLPVDPTQRYADAPVGVDATPPGAFAVAAPGAFVVGGRRIDGTTLVGFGPR